jgi:hypothetical protein
MDAQDFSGQYTGTYNNDPVVLLLSTTAANTYAGTMSDGTLNYQVSATGAGNTLKGTCSEPTLGMNLDLTGILSGNNLQLSLSILGSTIQVALVKAGSPATTKPATKPAAKPIAANTSHDPALVGRWTKQTNYNSGYGQSGSMSTEEQMIFYEDGRLADGGSRTVTSGSDWSGSNSSEGSGVLPGVFWYSKQQQIYLEVTENGKTQTVPLGKYYIENNNMLITGQNGTKMLFYKG